MRLLSIAASVCLLAVGSTAEAADVAAPSPEGTAFQTPPPDPSRKADAVLVFAGALSTRNMGSSANFDMHWPIGPNYDNYIVGAAYNHDFYSLWVRHWRRSRACRSVRLFPAMLRASNQIKQHDQFAGDLVWVAIQLRRSHAFQYLSHRWRDDLWVQFHWGFHRGRTGARDRKKW